MKNDSIEPGDLCYLSPDDLPIHPKDDTRLHGIINMHVFERAIRSKDADLVWDAMEFFSDIDLKLPAMFLNHIDLREAFSKFSFEITKMDEEDGWLDDRNCLVLFDGKVCLCCVEHLVLIGNELNAIAR